MKVQSNKFLVELIKKTPHDTTWDKRTRQKTKYLQQCFFALKIS